MAASESTAADDTVVCIWLVSNQNLVTDVIQREKVSIYVKQYQSGGNYIGEVFTDLFCESQKCCQKRACSCVCVCVFVCMCVFACVCVSGDGGVDFTLFYGSFVIYLPLSMFGDGSGFTNSQ